MAGDARQARPGRQRWQHQYRTGTPPEDRQLRPLQLPRGTLDPASIPRYERVAATFWDELRAGGAGVGDRLPSERILAERCRVSRATMRSALALLGEHGAVHAAPSRGWFIAGDVTTATSTTQERRVLELEGTSVPVLLARQLTFSQHGHPLEITDQAYRGDRYQFRATIT